MHFSFSSLFKVVKVEYTRAAALSATYQNFLPW